MIRAATFAALLAFSGQALAADPVFPPGSRIGLVPPTDMEVTRGITGFSDPRTGSAIVAVEMPVEAYPTVAAGFMDDALKSQGFAVLTRETVKVGGTDAILISGEQNDRGRPVPKAVLLAAQPTVTALVIGQLPVGSPESAMVQVREALKTVAIRDPLTLDQQIAALTFKIGDPAGFRPVRALAGSSLLMTDGPADVIQAASQPVLIVAQSFAPGPPPEGRDAFARAALGQNLLLKDVVFERSQSFRQGGADWHEIVAKGKDGPSDQPVVVLQTLRFAPDSYLRMVGIVRADQRDAVMPRLRRVVDSVATR